MTLKQHTAASVAVSGALYAASNSWELALACLLSGIFIDLDHLYDYLREYGWPIDVPELFHVCHTQQFNHAVLFFHGWEWLPFWGTVAAIVNWHPLPLGLLAGWGLHLLLDQSSNGPSSWGYFFLWRLRNGFVFSLTFPRPDQEQ